MKQRLEEVWEEQEFKRLKAPYVTPYKNKKTATSF